MKTRPARTNARRRTAVARVARVPEVIVEVLFERGMLSLAVRNIGSGAANDISVTFDPPFTGLGGTREVSSLPLFQHLAFLGPGREVSTLLDTSESYFRRNQPAHVIAHVRYADTARRTYATRIEHNLTVYRDLTWTV